MRTQTYHFTRLEGEANIKNDTVPLQVNCSGAVSYDFFETRTFRNDFYYIYLLKGKMVLPEYSLLPGDVVLLEPGHLYHYKSDGPTEYKCPGFNSPSGIKVLLACSSTPTG